MSPGETVRLMRLLLFSKLHQHYKKGMSLLTELNPQMKYGCGMWLCIPVHTGNCSGMFLLGDNMNIFMPI